MSEYTDAWKQYPKQVFNAADRLANALIPPVSGALSYSGETLSARAWRASEADRVWGKVFVPAINLCFFWQSNHCRGAYSATKEGHDVPPQYRDS